MSMPKSRCWRWNAVGCRKEATHAVRIGCKFIRHCEDHQPKAKVNHGS